MSSPASSRPGLISETASASTCKQVTDSIKAPISVRHTCQMCGTLFKQRDEFDRHVGLCGDEVLFEDGKTKHTSCNIKVSLDDVKRAARFTWKVNKPIAGAVNKDVEGTRAVVPAVTKELVQPMKSKRKRKLKDFSDFHTDFNMNPINEIENPKNLNNSKVYKSDGTRRTAVRNARHSNIKSESKMEKRKKGMEHLNENRDRLRAKKQTSCKKKNVSKTPQNHSKESSSKIKILSARIIPPLESNDSHVEANAVLELGTGRPVPQDHEIVRKAETFDGGLSDMEIESVCSDSDIELSKLDKDIKPSMYTDDIHTDYESSIEDIHQEAHKWFNFSNLKHAIFKCIYEKCSFSTNTHTTWLQHFKRTHMKKSRKYPQPYCMKCDNSANDKKALKEHLLVMHNDTMASPVGYRYCSVLHEDTGHDIVVLACILCGFVSDSVSFFEGHQCERLKFYFYCPWCDQQETHYEAMDNHIKCKHADEIIFGKEVSNNYKNVRTSEKDPACNISDHETCCKTCFAEFENNNDLKLHVNNMHAIFPYGCGVCRLTYGRVGSIRTHMNKVHLLAHQCRTCKRRFGARSDLVRHESTHAEVKPFKCDYCDRRYADKGALNSHISVNHPKEQIHGTTGVTKDQPESYMCHICGESLETSKLFQRHQKNKHLDTVVELLHCKICLQSFNTRRKYNTHRCTADSSLRETDVRGTNTVDSDTLMELLNQAGPGKKVKCTLCNNWLSNRKSLKQHLFQMHLDDHERNYACNVCERRFWNKKDLLVHHRIHSNYKPYHCKICSKSFRQQGHVKEHLLSHASSSKFNCPLCSHAFKTKPSLRRHVLGHCKMFPFECPVRSCSSKSATLALLFAHMRNCTETNQPDYECKLCDQDYSLVDVQSAIAHMKSHEKDSIYLCVTCEESFTSSVSLCWHKIKSDHFSDAERSEAAKSETKTKQNFKCMEVDSDIPLDDLINMYDYVKQRDFESVEGGFMDETVLINETEEHISEQNIYIDDQSTLLKPEYSEIDIVIDNDQLPPFAETVELSQTDGHDRMTEKVTESKNVNGSASSHAIGPKLQSLEEIQEKYPQTNTPPLVEFPVSLDLLSGSNTVVVVASETYTKHDAVAIGGNSEHSKTCSEASYVRGEEDRYIPAAIEEIQVEEKSAVHLDENVLTGLKILDENGDEVMMYNQEGYQIPIQGNPDVLQSVLSTGKYSIQLSSSNTELAQDVATMESHMQYNKAIDTLIQAVSKPSVERIDEVVAESGICDLTCETNDTSVDVSSAKRVRKLKNKEAVKNVDKINGVFTDLEAEVSNKKNVNGSMNYKVRLCYYEDRSKNENEYPLKCDVCNKRYRRVKDLNLHKKVHLSNEERPYQCDECDSGFTTKHSLRNHQRVHTDERPFVCDQCHKSYRQRGHLLTHLRTHADYRPFQCSNCNKTFICNALLKAHMKFTRCSDAPSSLSEDNKCDICGKYLSSIEELKTHKTTHLSKEQASNLLSVFSYGQTLTADKDDDAPTIIANEGVGVLNNGETLNPNQDVDVRTIDAIEDVDVPAKTKPKKKRKAKEPRMCDSCGKVVTNLERHKMLHITDSSVPCPQCQRKFTTHALLKSHVRKSHPNELFQCDICGIKLVNRGCLNHHMKLHNQRSVYNCLKCKKKYLSKDRLLCHLVACVGDNFIQQLDACLINN